MEIIIDCPKCTVRHSWNTDNKNQLCPRCVTMEGTDISAILVELRKSRVPGQEPVLKLIEVLANKVGVLERLLNGLTDVKEAAIVSPADTEQN